MTDLNAQLAVQYGLNGAFNKMIKSGGAARGVFASRGLVCRDSTYGRLVTPAAIVRNHVVTMAPTTPPVLYTQGFASGGTLTDLTTLTTITAASLVAGGTTYVRGAAFAGPASPVGDVIYGALVDLAINQNQALGQFEVALFGNPMGGGITSTSAAVTQSSVPAVALKAVFDPPAAIGRYRIWLFPAVAARNSGFAFVPMSLRANIAAAIADTTAGHANSPVVVGMGGSLVSGTTAAVSVSVTLLSHGSVEIDSLLDAYNRRVRSKLGLKGVTC